MAWETRQAVTPVWAALATPRVTMRRMQSTQEATGEVTTLAAVLQESRGVGVAEMQKMQEVVMQQC